MVAAFELGSVGCKTFDQRAGKLKA